MDGLCGQLYHNGANILANHGPFVERWLLFAGVRKPAAGDDTQETERKADQPQVRGCGKWRVTNGRGDLAIDIRNAS